MIITAVARTIELNPSADLCHVSPMAELHTAQRTLHNAPLTGRRREHSYLFQNVSNLQFLCQHCHGGNITIRSRGAASLSEGVFVSFKLAEAVDELRQVSKPPLVPDDMNRLG
jgi:hypothetical protein